MSIPLPADGDLSSLARQLAPHLALLQQDPRDRQTVAAIVAAYLAAIPDEVVPAHYERKRWLLERFAAAFGSRTVAECSPLLLGEWIRQGRGWRSAWTRAGVATCVQACFNWAARMGLIRANPFAGVRFHQGTPGRAMTEEEFRALLRHSPAHYRRFLFALRWTGARPGELCALRWSQVSWERCVAVLPEHKTFRKTRRPRVIILVARMLQLLAWIRRHPPRRRSCTAWLRQQLSRGPVKATVINARARARGFTYTQMAWARKALGVVAFLQDQGQGQRRRYYLLPAVPPAQVPRTREPAGDPDPHIFLDAWGHPLRRRALCAYFSRVRQRAGLAKDCRLYGLRHWFGTQAVKARLNLLTVATLMGHADVRMTQHYCHVAEDFAHLRQAAEQIHGAAGERAAAPPAAVAAPLPFEEPIEEPPAARVNEPAPPAAVLSPAHAEAYQLARGALEQNPTLRTDREIYQWLRTRPEAAGKLPPSADTFSRYLRAARRHYEGAGKRAQRRLRAAEGVGSRE